MLLYLLGFLVTVFLALLVHFKIKTHGMVEHLEKIPGPRLVPILGTSEIFYARFDDLIMYFIEQWKTYNSHISKIWLGSMCFVTITDPNYIEKLLSSKTEIVKSAVYQFLRPWAGDGLITGTGERWKTHRKLLDPAFHSKILEQFMDVFNNNANILVDKFSKHLNGPEFEIRQYVTLCALDNICGSKRRLAFLDLLIEKSEDIPSLTDEIIREEVDTFMEAGHDTLATAMEWTLWLLSQHQDEQEKAVQELNKIFGDSKRDPTSQDLQNMIYLEKMIKESLRLYPSPLIYGRTLVQDLSLGDYVIPGGTNVTLAPYLIHRNPEHFPDPEKFDPERFSPENIARRHPFAYVPFSLGLRNCIGKRFAMLQLKATFSQILRKFKLLPDSTGPEEITLVPDFVVKSRKELRIKIKPRKEINV